MQITTALLILLTTALLILLTAGLTGNLEATTSGISTDAVLKESYGKLKDGRDVALLTLTNRKGMIAKITEYGAILVSLEIPYKSRKVFGTPMVIGDRIEEDFGSLKLADGYDHAWVLKKGTGMCLAAHLKDPKSERVLEISTNQPAMQSCTGNFLKSAITGKKGLVYAKRTALCLETEGFPYAPNHPTSRCPCFAPARPIPTQ